MYATDSHKENEAGILGVYSDVEFAKCIAYEDITKDLEDDEEIEIFENEAGSTIVTYQRSDYYRTEVFKTHVRQNKMSESRKEELLEKQIKYSSVKEPESEEEPEEEPESEEELDLMAAATEYGSHNMLRA